MALSENARGALLMSIAMAAFTVNDACMKAVTASLPLYQSIFLRGLAATVAIAIIGVRSGTLRFSIPREDLRWLGLRTVGEIASTVTFLTALRHMPLANLSSIMQSLPLAVTLGAALWLNQPVGWRRLTAIGIGFLGVLLIIRPGTEGFDRWALLGVISVAFVVLRDLSTRCMSSGLTSVTVALSAASSVTLTALMILPFTGWRAPTAHEWALIAGAATFLIGGYIVIVMATRTGNIGFVAPFRYTSLLFAVALGWAAFGQFPDTVTLAGGSIVIATGLYTFHRDRQLARQRAKAG